MEKLSSFGKSNQSREDILNELRKEISKVLCIVAAWDANKKGTDNYVAVFEDYKEHQGLIEDLVKKAGLEVKDSFDGETLIEYFKEITDAIGDVEFNSDKSIYERYSKLVFNRKFFSPSWDAIVKIRERCNKEIRVEPIPVENEENSGWKKNVFESLRRQIVRAMYIRVKWDFNKKDTVYELVLAKNYKDYQKEIEGLAEEGELEVKDHYDKEALIEYMEEITPVIGDVEIGHYKYYGELESDTVKCLSPSCECLRKDPPIQKKKIK